ncbi:MAG: hypothetical protein V7756_03620 [Halopseudomonas sp.]|uniref:hypothetical protein n=1 Tax=Halopseudomonas sp. TaxID=2901191 RepID=UPI0030013A70
MRTTSILGIAIVFLLAPPTTAVATTMEQATTEQARSSLKNYGFVRCLDAAYRDSQPLDDDLAAAGAAYHYMGSGAHFIQQDEEILDVTHDPYQSTAEFIARVYPTTHAQTQSQERKNPMIACLSIYNSIEYDDFIRRQDAYIINVEN